ncbi:MAG TPA: hypothetical protein P5055_10990, partial [Candidatus Paceibacterota bacterium]|nr:hypothetical protein [Candidatus Paceibacterota bacterium]
AIGGCIWRHFLGGFHPWSLSIYRSPWGDEILNVAMRNSRDTAIASNLSSPSTVKLGRDRIFGAAGFDATAGIWTLHKP